MNTSVVVNGYFMQLMVALKWAYPVCEYYLVFFSRVSQRRLDGETRIADNSVKKSKQNGKSVSSKTHNPLAR